MWTLGPIAFAAPWVLAALILLPALWFLLRVTPPAPRRMTFPALRLLMGLQAREDVTARTPWWLILLRLLILTLVIIGLARPLLNPVTGAAGGGPLLLVIDDGWASAARLAGPSPGGAGHSCPRRPCRSSGAASHHRPASQRRPHDRWQPGRGGGASARRAKPDTQSLACRP